ncbi:MAG: EamA family transporter RarD [Bacillota bacterium]|nr:EamA family transporter RarD [Bacillota bacterium]MDW7677374.1 EamA family transporter RarD [Bacillota bacterium]
MNHRTDALDQKLPLMSVLLVYTIWGIQPLYWQLFHQVPLTHILAHRIIWSVCLLFPVILLTHRWVQLTLLFRSLRRIGLTALCAVMIASNWMLYIYAVSTKQVVEASMGQYITPILVIFLGVFILWEKTQLHEVIATLIAAAGVGILTVHVGRVPAIALLLILTFTSYTFLKKTIRVDPLVGITAEMLVLLPFMVGFLVFKQMGGTPLFMSGSRETISLLLSTGLFTSIPLLLFAYGVPRLQLSNLGFIQYYAPTINLLIAIFIFDETFTHTHLVSFGLIWTAIAIVVLKPLGRRMRPKKTAGFSD